MAKNNPKRNRKQHTNPNTTPKTKARRNRNHSPAVERKRSENAWHTNPLAPIPPKALRHQAMTLMRTMYKPAFAQLSNEEKRVNSISEKRKADNSYYLTWLTKQSELLGAHEDAARQQVEAAGAQAQQEVQKGWADLHGELAANMEATPGSVSNPAEATAFDLSDEALKSAHDIQDQRTATNDQLGTLGDTANLGQTINFAQIAAMEGRRIADQQDALGDIRDARQETRLTKAAEAAKEFTRGMDKEIEKAQARAQIAASEATAAIEAKRFGLDAKKAQLEAGEFNFEKQFKTKKLGLEQRELALQREESKINKELEEGKLTQNQAKIRIEKAKLKNEGKKIENEGGRTPGEKAGAREDQQAKNQQINANIQTVLTKIQHQPSLRKLAQNNYPKLEQQLAQKYGYNPLAIAAAAQLYLNGSISDALKAKLKAVGYNGKYV